MAYQTLSDIWFSTLFVWRPTDVLRDKEQLWFY